MLDDGQFLALIERLKPFFMGLSLSTARVLAFLSIFPLFTATGVRGQIRATFAVVLALPIALLYERTFRTMDPSLPQIVILVAKETIMGSLIGAAVAVPFWGVQTAGDIIDFERSASAANLADPVNANENSLLGTIMLYASLWVFVVMGGVFVVIDVVYQSFVIWPPYSLSPDTKFDAMVAFGMLLGRLFKLGIIVAGPVMIAILLVDIILVFSSRIAKQIQIFDLSIIVKNFVVALAIPLYGIYIAQYIETDMRGLIAFVSGFLTGK